MSLAATIMVGVVAFLHVYFLVLEMFLWTKPYGRRVFALSEERAKQTASLAANQGLYNGFLAAGLVWGIYLKSDAIQWFFLGCVMVAGIYGAMTVNRKILFVQAVPAAIAIVLLKIAAT